MTLANHDTPVVHEQSSDVLRPAARLWIIPWANSLNTWWRQDAEPADPPPEHHRLSAGDVPPAQVL